MRVRLSEIWSTLVGGLWFLPGLMVLGSFGLAILTLWLDDRYSYELQTGLGLIYASSVDGGRELLSTIAGSMMTVTGVVFSVTIVTLSLTSNQYGPRLLRNFLNDRGNQVVLGTFLGTFTYCLVILRTLQDSSEDATVPEISITVGALLALASLGVLIYFIHHISQAIQASSIFSGVGHELAASINKVFPERLGSAEGESHAESLEQAEPDESAPHRKVHASRAGYVRMVDTRSIMNAAVEHNAIVRLYARPGTYVFENGLLARSWTANAKQEQLADSVSTAIIIGNSRTPFQDIDFLVSQLVQSALLALSSGVNNSLVAIEAIDWLGASLARIAERDLPDSNRHDDDGLLRVIVEPPTFESLLHDSFNSLRESSRGNTLVTLHLLDTILLLVPHCHRQQDLEALRSQATLLQATGTESTPDGYDRGRITAAYNDVVSALART